MTKALTLTQPWATLVALGIKRIETRGWRTEYRGPLLIHAGKGMPAEAEDFAVALHGRIPQTLPVAAGDLPRGVIIAKVRLWRIESTYGAVANGDADDDERELGDYGPGRWAWLLDQVELIDPPVPWRGALNLWEGPDL